MVHFDWKKIIRATAGDCSKILAVFQILSYGYSPINRFDPQVGLQAGDYRGYSFLLNPRMPILDVERGVVSLEEFAIYVAVAALRNPLDYYRLGTVSLPRRELIYTEQSIAYNRLLRIDEQDVLFKYEFILEDA